MEMSEYCAACLLRKRLNDHPADADPKRIEAYRRRVRAIIEENPHETSAEKDYEICVAHDEIFGASMDFPAIKRHFNDLMLQLEPVMRAGVARAEDPLRRAIQYAMTGNFIDFAAMDSVDEGQLRRLMDEGGGFPVEDKLLDGFRREIMGSRRLLYILDNCGEIVMDKVLMRVLRAINPAMEITALVKGGPIVNDATREDAAQVRLSEVARVMDTGCPIAGVPEGRISEACRAAMREADVIVSKGQANYETLCGCGLNIFYIFMCKCQLFMDRFNVPQFSGLIVRE